MAPRDVASTVAAWDVGVAGKDTGKDTDDLVDLRGKTYALGRHSFVRALNRRAVKIARRVAAKAAEGDSGDGGGGSSSSSSSSSNNNGSSGGKGASAPLAPEIIEVLNGRLPFVKRLSPLVYFWTCMAVAWILWFGVARSGLPQTLLAAAGMYLVLDFYSGVLHVMLDDEWNMRVPLLSQPCLEFQFHHHIPDDGCSRPFEEGCGDLNFIVFVHVAVLGWVYQSNGGKYPLLLATIAFKILFAYWGIWNHRQAHQLVSKRPGWVRWMQERGVMLSPAAHKVHHTPPHDDEFCLLGLTSKLVTAIFKLNLGSIFWIVLFVLLTAFDAIAVSRAAKAVF